MAEEYGTATWQYWQKIPNAAGARGSFRDRPPVPVRARLVFERDGEVWLDGTATRLGFDGRSSSSSTSDPVNKLRIVDPDVTYPRPLIPRHLQ